MALYFTHPYGRMMANRRMFRQLMNENWGDETNRFSFPMDVIDNAEGYELKAVLPGVAADDLNIQVVNDIVTIQGEIKTVNDEQATYLLQERQSGRFMRTIRLPEPVDSAKVEASLKDGILTLVVPKAEEARPKTIKVNVN